MPANILIIEDEKAIADIIIYALKTEGYEPIWVSTGRDGKEMMESQAISLVILDIGLPDINGFEWCRTIRKQWDLPIIILTARSDEIDRIVGLEIGADDYMTKPFSPRELTARVKAILRRTEKTFGALQANEAPPSPLFSIDEMKRRIEYLGTPLELSPYEFKILRALIKHPGRVYSRDELLNLASQEPDMSMDRTIDAHIKSIRKKLRALQPETDPIETHRGFGYALKETP